MRTSFATGRGLTPRTHRLLSGVLSLLLVALNCTGARPQTGPTLSGQTKRVLLIPNNTADAGEIMFKSDRDNDGMPDDDEAANGTDPDDPSDADADKDNDGLSNGDEVAMKSNVNNPDSDGDGVSDGDEARLGSNPNDANDKPPVNATVVSIRVEPAALDLSINSLLGPQPGRLRVVGTLSTGATVDLTTAPGTAYQSQNQAVALVDDFGTAAGVSLGTTSIVVTNGALTAQVPVNVSSYTPVGLSKISIPGYPNSVAVQGAYAYIASGAAGLLVVDVSNYKAPRVVGSLNPGGNADDVKVVGDLAYVAAGAAGCSSSTSPTPRTRRRSARSTRPGRRRTWPSAARSSTSPTATRGSRSSTSPTPRTRGSPARSTRRA